VIRRLLWGLSILVLGASLGLGSAWALINAPGFGKSAQVGAWRIDLFTGSTTADMYTRARIAVILFLALNREETIYYVASTDDRGWPLRPSCVYKVEGRVPAARWWSITAYGPDYFLIDNPIRRFSFNMRSVRPDAAGRFAFVTAPTEQPGNWLPTPTRDQFYLTYRLYNPAPEIGAHPERLDPPKITREGACE
jgi:hypothetical protein